MSPTLSWSIHAVAIAALLACSDSPTSPSPIQVLPTEGVEGFAAELDALRVGLGIPGMAAAIVHDERVVWSRGLGYADADAQRPATPTTPFHLASLTKPFASTVVMRLVEEGLIDLDAPVSDYGVSLPGASGILVRHLMTHTSEGVPGSSYSYNGNRFGNLDRVILSASGRTFAELVVERVLAPLGLRHTAPNPLDPAAFGETDLNRDAFLADMSKGYEPSGAAVVGREHPSIFSTAAGMVASVEDMAAFSIAIDQGRFLEPATWEQVFTPATSNNGATLPYGLGWFVFEHQGVTFQWHYGWWTTNSSLIVRAPEQGLTFVVVANSPRLSSAYGLGGDANVMRSDVARLFIDAFVFGDEPLPQE